MKLDQETHNKLQVDIKVNSLVLLDNIILFITKLNLLRALRELGCKELVRWRVDGPRAKKVRLRVDVTRHVGP